MALIHEFKREGDYLFRHRGILPLFILIPALALCVFNEYYEGSEEFWYEDGVEWLALSIALFGLSIRIYTVGHTPSGTSGRNTTHGQKAQMLNTTGLYSVLRHPLYLGNFFMWAGPGMLTLNIWFMLLFTVLFWLYYERIMFAEEQYLTTLYGNEYLDWSITVPTFIPRITQFKSPSEPFNWKKILKNEKNGLLAMFLVFWGFDVIPDLINGEPDALKLDFWTISLLISALYYSVIKTLQRTNRL